MLTSSFASLVFVSASLVMGAGPNASNQGKEFKLSGDAKLGKQTYQRSCALCHGAGGGGDGIAAEGLDPKPRALNDSSFMDQKSDEHLYNVVMEGGKALGLSPYMGAWKHVLTDQEIRDVVAYARTLSIAKGNQEKLSKLTNQR